MGFLSAFLVAATPLPDEPVVVPLGLLKYRPAKFCLAFFAGKLSITIVGAYLGVLGHVFLAPMIGQEIFMAASIILTVVVTIVLLKVDVDSIARKVLGKKVEVP